MNKQKGKLLLKIFLAIFIIIIVAIMVSFFWIHSKLSNVQYETLNKADLGINSSFYQNATSNLQEAEFPETKKVVFFGTDSRDPDNFYSGRSDTIMIASINTKSKSIKLISIPRDTYVNIPDYGMDKINHAYAYGQEQLSIKTINSNFGLDIEEYITIDFSGLTNIINQVGGVVVELNSEEVAFINERSSTKIEGTGKILLNGEQALIHSRNRYVGNDFYRTARQRDILIALLNKLSEQDLSTLLSLSNEFLKQVKTNINVSECISYGIKAFSEKDTYLSNITSIQIPSTEYSEGKYINGIYYFTTDLEKAKEEFQKYLYEN